MRYRILVLFVLLLGGTEVFAQRHRFIPTDDVAYTYIDRLQRRGHLLSLHPTALPYRMGEVREALAGIDRDALSRTERHWVGLLEAMVGATPGEEQAVLGVHLKGGLDAANSRRLDPLRPLGDDLRVFEHLAAQVYFEQGPWVAQLGARHDLYYDRDPDGLDTANRLMARSEESYAGVHTSFVSLTLGRYALHWGQPGQPAALISDNPRSYDHLTLRLGGSRLALRSLLGELDSITGDGFFNGRAGDNYAPTHSERRYLAAHRFDWRPTPNLVLSLMEAALYSGPNSNLSLKYLNPVNPFFFVVDNRPKNDENNGFIAGLLWYRLGRTTLQGQLMVDDLDALNGTEPASAALTGTLIYAATQVDLGATLEVVTARTYNALQPEGKHLYLLRGLATQFSDYIHTSLFADLYPHPALTLSPRLHLLAQGERDIRQPFPRNEDDVPMILDGTVERTVRTAVEVFYQPEPRWWVRLDLGLNFIRNQGHVRGQDVTRLSAALSFGVRLQLHRPFSLDL